MEKAIEIKRRAQRCIQNGDLDGALNEYEKLVDSEESDPYNYVLLADLLYKKGDQSAASERYLSAVSAYEKASLYKNAIAVCKKMTRLSLSPAKVMQSLGRLHALDGLAGEAALYYVQYAEHMVRANAPADAANALRQAFDVCQDNIRVLEQLSEAWLLAGDNKAAASALVEAASYYRSRGAEADARRCTERATHLDAEAASMPVPVPAAPAHAAPEPTAPEPVTFSPGMPAADATPTTDAPADGHGLHDIERGATHAQAPAPGSVRFDRIETHSHFSEAAAETEAAAHARIDDLETGRHHAPPVHTPESGEDDDAPVLDIDASDGDMAAALAELEAAGAMPSDSGHDEAEPAVAPTPQPVASAATDEPVYEIPADDAGEPPAVAPAPAPAADDEVYVIEDEPAPVAAAPAPAPPVAHVPETPVAPGLAHASADPVSVPSHEESQLHRVETLLAQAQDHFRTGDRELAAQALMGAAQAYESLGRLDNAATIYRSLGHGAQASHEVLQAWLANCEHRGDTTEAAQVACELGDRALNDGQEADARGWFERALAMDAGNETATRRLHRLEGASAAPGDGANIATAAPGSAGNGETGRVEVAVGRAEAVSFDLTGLLAEFQRGVEVQLAGDARSHYDLGMTYREMGLLEQAVESFRFAQGDTALAPRAHEMIGRCFSEQGRHIEAAGEYRRALEMHGTGAGDTAELRYHLGSALAECGEAEAALAEYTAVQAESPGFEDVEERVAALRRVLGRP